MKQNAATLEQLFPCWKKLTPAQQMRVKNAAEEKLFLKGQVLHHGSEDCSGLFLVKSGRLRAYIVSDSGKEITLYRLSGWDICLFSAACIMKNISFAIYVQAEKDTLAYVIPADLYEDLMQTSLPIADYTSQLMASRFSDVVWIMEQVLFTSFDVRLASFLLEQSDMEDSLTLPLTHDEIARHLGSAREVVTRMLKYFADEDIVQLARGKITVKNKEKLQQLTEHLPSLY